MKTKGVVLIVLGILGAIFVCTFDIIMKKPVNDISGPKSISALVFCALLAMTGVTLILKNVKKFK